MDGALDFQLVRTGGIQHQNVRATPIQADIIGPTVVYMKYAGHSSRAFVRRRIEKPRWTVESNATTGSRSRSSTSRIEDVSSLCMNDNIAVHGDPLPILLPWV